MNPPPLFPLSWLPDIAVVSIPATLLLLLCGWIASILRSVREGKLVLLQVFPLTHPFAFLYLAIVRFRKWLAQLPGTDTRGD